MSKRWQQLRDEDVQSRQMKPLTKNQAAYLRAIETHTLTICTGAPGSGKSFLSCWAASTLLRDGRTKKVVLCRPLVACGQDIGFLPGGIDEKVGPYMRPLLAMFEEFFSAAELEKYLDSKAIELWPLELMRGLTFKDCFVILSEAQSATYVQLRMFLTRLGFNCRAVVEGDVNQSDLFAPKDCPLGEVARRLKGHEDIAVVRLGPEDTVRSALVRYIDEKLGGD